MEHRIPVHLTEQLGSMLAPVLSIYFEGDSPSIVLTDPQTLVLDDGTNTLTLDLSGKSTSDVVSAISRSAMAYTARPLLEVPDVGAVGLMIDLADQTVDGGQVLRAPGHVVQRLEGTKLRLLPPYNEDRYHPWFPVVNRGWVVGEWKGATWKFAVPEYDDQTWSTFYGHGYMDVEDEEAQRLGSRVLGLARTPVYWKRGNVHLSVNGVEQDAASIRDVDEANGFIYLNREYSDRDIVRVSYTYREAGYIYPGIDFNPTEFHNPAVLDRWVVVYLLPYIGPDGVLRRDCVHHVESSTLIGAIQSIPKRDEPVLLLGAVQVRFSPDPKEAQVLDTRTKGGGVKWGKFEDATKVNREVLSSTDRGFYDGRPYPGGLSLFVTLPQDLRSVFADAEIDGIIRRYMEFGTYPILSFE